MYLSFPARKSKSHIWQWKDRIQKWLFPRGQLSWACCRCPGSTFLWHCRTQHDYFSLEKAHLFVLKLNVYKTKKLLSQWTWTWWHMAVFPALRRWGQEDQEFLGSLDCTASQLAFLYLKQARVSGQRNLNWESVSIRQLVAESLGCFLFNDWCGRAQPTGDGGTPGQIMLDASSWMQAEQAMRNKSGSTVPSWHLLPWFLSWVSALISLCNGP